MKTSSMSGRSSNGRYAKKRSAKSNGRRKNTNGLQQAKISSLEIAKLKRPRGVQVQTGRIRLGVNIDHVATLRQVRGGGTIYPDIMNAARLAITGGAKQITIHLREDRRHIQDSDLSLLAKKLPVLLNLEMAATPEMQLKALKHRPEWVCIVPEKREELTTEGGLDVVRAEPLLKSMISALARRKNRNRDGYIQTSLFIEPDEQQVRAAARTGAHAIEFHTGKWVRLKGKAKKVEWQKLCANAHLANHLGLHVHAGHGLCFETTREILGLPFLEEVNIGHSLVCYSIEMGLKAATQKMWRILTQKPT